MKWFTVEQDYLTYLRSCENRIPIADYGTDKFKPFFGALFEIGDLVYITQVSHAKPRHSKLKEEPDFIKLYDGTRLIAVVNLNYMFPVHKNKLIDVKYKHIDNFRTFESDMDKGCYITLLKKEMKEIKNRELNKKALSLYDRKYNFPDDRVSLRCFDFKDLEQKCKDYEISKNLEKEALDQAIATK